MKATMIIPDEDNKLDEGGDYLYDDFDMAYIESELRSVKFWVKFAVGLACAVLVTAIFGG